MASYRTPPLVPIHTGIQELDRWVQSAITALRPTLELGSNRLQGFNIPPPVAANDGAFVQWSASAQSFVYASAIPLAPTGVTPGTYGDATHVGQFTVNTYGQVTFAANVAITGLLPAAGAAGDVLLSNGSAWGAAALSGAVASTSSTGVVALIGVTQYDVLLGDTSGTIASLAPGTTGQVLTSQGVGANPIWQNAAGAVVAPIAKSASFTAATTYTWQLYAVTTSTSVIAASLPAASGNAGLVLGFKKVDTAAGGVQVLPNGYDLVDGQPMRVLYSAKEVLWVESDGTGWQVVDWYAPSWKCYLDFDFTVQTNQVILTDSTVTIGGLSWTKTNTANEPLTTLNPSTHSFTQPNVGVAIQITVASTTLFTVNDYVNIGGTAGQYQVTSIDNSTQMHVKNLGWSGNAAPGTTVPTGSVAVNVAAAMAVVNGVGLFIRPVAATAFGTSWTAPTLSILAASVIPSFTLMTPLRAWMYESSNTSAANYDVTLLSVFTKVGSSGINGYSIGHEFNSLTQSFTQNGYNSVIASGHQALPSGSPYNLGAVYQMELPSGFVGFNGATYNFGSFGASTWPDAAALTFFTAQWWLTTTAASTANVTFSSEAGTAAVVQVGAMAMRNTSTNLYQSTIARMRLDAK